MNRRLLQLLLFLFVAIPVLAHAQTIYFKNGEELECESFKQTGDRVVVHIAAGTDLDFASNDVDLEKSKPIYRNTVSSKNSPESTECLRGQVWTWTKSE